MKTKDLKKYFETIKNVIDLHKDELVVLDQAFGDGDLGISMSQGFRSVYEYVKESEEKEFSKMFLNIAKTFNENAPSSLGTIVSFVFMAMAKELKCVEDLNMENFSKALKAGKNNVCLKTGSDIKQKTMLDALGPCCDFIENSLKEDKTTKQILKEAAKKALDGAIATKEMVAMHGRAAYHKEKTLGHIDGGAMMVAYVFEAIANVYDD